VAQYMYTHDMVSYQVGFQNVMTYTVGFMGEFESNLYLINTSNNGNGNPNLYNTSDPEYGKYHFTAESPGDITAVLLDAVNSILSQNMTLIAPVVPVAKTMSSNNIYMALFKPKKSNFWEGNIVKFKINEALQIMDANDEPATWPNGAIREDAVPIWSTKDWADISTPPGILYSDRKIYTYLGASTDLASFNGNQFATINPALDATVLGNPTHAAGDIIDYIRGRDVFDEDGDSEVFENREVITGDVLHSQPLVVQYVYPNGSANTMVFFGSNDGMLHAVLDSTDSNIDTPGGEIQHGTEEWAFIPPDQLPRLKDIVEGSGHQYFVDASPRAFREDVNNNGVLDAEDRIIIVCGQGKGGSSYFALDVTDYQNPVFLWRIIPAEEFSSDVVIPELGQSWSEPQFGYVKTSDSDTTGTPVFFIGGGYSSDNSAGATVLAVDVVTGDVVRQFLNDSVDITDMNFSFTSSVSALDEDNNGFVDKIYIGDLGGQLWRIGQFEVDSAGNALVFPDSDENINSWQAQVFFRAPTFLMDATYHTRKFHYPPSVTLEKGYDLVFIGTGDREMACRPDTAPDRIYCLKDTHTAATFTEMNLADVTIPTDPVPDLKIAGDVDGNGEMDMGWYIRLVDSTGTGIGEKVLAKGTVFYKTYYITTFIPTNDPCVPGGDSAILALNYKTGAAVMTFGGSDVVRRKLIGGGIPSNPVPIITGHGQKLLVSVGSTLPVAGSDSIEAGILSIDPLAPEFNFYYLWWREL
jgi:type IV pilus assembly protein PilY1